MNISKRAIFTAVPVILLLGAAVFFAYDRLHTRQNSQINGSKATNSGHPTTAVHKSGDIIHTAEVKPSKVVKTQVPAPKQEVISGKLKLNSANQYVLETKNPKADLILDMSKYKDDPKKFLDAAEIKATVTPRNTVTNNTPTWIFEVSSLQN